MKETERPRWIPWPLLCCDGLSAYTQVAMDYRMAEDPDGAAASSDGTAQVGEAAITVCTDGTCTL